VISATTTETMTASAKNGDEPENIVVSEVNTGVLFDCTEGRNSIMETAGVRVQAGSMATRIGKTLCLPEEKASRIAERRDC